MKKESAEENPVLTLLVTGRCQDDSVDKAIELLTEAAQKNPKKLLSALEEVAEVGIDGMLMVALTVLVSTAREDFLQKNGSDIIMLLSEYGPPRLLEFVELLKSKVFGRGLGSRSQKWVKNIMESWSPKTVVHFCNKYPKTFYSLIMIIHPRYVGIRGRLIRDFLKNQQS